MKALALLLTGAAVLVNVDATAVCTSHTAYALADPPHLGDTVHTLQSALGVGWQVELLVAGTQLVNSTLTASLAFVGQIEELPISTQCLDLCDLTTPPNTCANATAGSMLDLRFDLLVPDVRGLYKIELRSTSADGVELFCTSSEFLQAKFYAYFWALLTFGLAATASWELAVLFPRFRLPLITGYLFIGILMGPFVTGMIDRFNISLVGEYINEFALAFISFAAGASVVCFN